MIDLDAIEARAEKATEGPWRTSSADALEIWADRDVAGWDAFFIATLRTRINPDPGNQAAADAEFIAHARSDIPALVARVRELEAALGEVVNTLGPERICNCRAHDCGLVDEASEALRVAHAALADPKEA